MTVNRTRHLLGYPTGRVELGLVGVLTHLCWWYPQTIQRRICEEHTDLGEGEEMRRDQTGPKNTSLVSVRLQSRNI